MEIGSDCYLLTSRLALMPGVYLGESYANGLVSYDVESPSGKVYSCKPENVFCFAEGRAMLRERRAEQLTKEGYAISLRSGGSYRVYCTAKHGQQGGYICTPLGAGEFHCTCPAHAKDGECKHSLGICGLLYAKASEAARQGKAQHVETYMDLADAPEKVRVFAPVGNLTERLQSRGLRPDLDFA